MVLLLFDSQENHKFIATRCQILRLKCTKFNFGWGSAPDPAVGAYSPPPDPLAGFKGPTSKGKVREAKNWAMGGERKGDGKGRRGGEFKLWLAKPAHSLPSNSSHKWFLSSTKTPFSYQLYLNLAVLNLIFLNFTVSVLTFMLETSTVCLKKKHPWHF